MTAPSAHANLLVSSFATNEVIQYNGATGAYIGAFVASSAGGLSGPMGLAYNGGNLFVASSATSSVLKYNGSTGVFQGTFASGSGLSSPNGIVFGPDGNLYVASNGSSEIKKFNGTSGAFMGDFVLNSPGPLVGAVGLVYG